MTILDRALTRAIDKPVTAVAWLCLAQIVLWTLAPLLVHRSPPLDVVESLMWGREWVLGTYKHPALPAWILEASRWATGSISWPPFLISQLFVAATFLIVFRLGLELFGNDQRAQRAALVGTILLTGCYFFSWPSVEFNHSVAQMPLWAGVILALWRAIKRGQILDWLILGVVGALSLYAKLSSAVVLIVAAAFILSEVQARRQLANKGPWLGLAAFLVVVAPLAQWLLVTNFQPLHYASSRAEGQAGPLVFLSELGASLLGVLAMAALAGMLPSIGRKETADAALAKSDGMPGTEPLAWRFLIVFAVAPLALIAVISLLTGTTARGSWAAPMLSLSGLLVVALTRQSVDARAAQIVAKAGLATLFIVPALYAGSVVFDVGAKGRVKRQSWPQTEIAERFAGVWSKATEGQPLRIIAGDAWTAGLVALTGKDRPSILTEGSIKLSPWIDAGRLQREGALIVWEKRAQAQGAEDDATYIPPKLLSLIGTRHQGQETFKAAWGKASNTITIGYAIVPPAP